MEVCGRQWDGKPRESSEGRVGWYLGLYGNRVFGTACLLQISYNQNIIKLRKERRNT
jgi:hypothetical protein